MSFQKNDQSDFDFSIIDKKSTTQNKLNFSVQSLLQQHPPQQSVSDHSSCKTNGNVQNDKENNKQKQQQGWKNVQNGSFLQDLQKLEEQLSFQTQLYNVYHQETSTIVNSLNPLTKSQFLHAKSNSHLLTTKEQQNTINSFDDYGYLVIDFGKKHTKSSNSKLALNQISRVKSTKINTHQGTKSSRGLKLSSQESRVMGESCNFIKENSKTKINRNSKSITNRKSLQIMALGKLLSPPKIGGKSLSKEKNILKGINKTKNNNKLESRETKTRQQNKQPKTKQNQTAKQHTIKQQKSPLSNAKSKSNSKTLLQNKSSKKTISTTITQSAKHSNKSYTKSTNRQGNVYSEYYGFDDIGESQRLVMKSNCIYSEKCVKSPGGKRLSTSKEKGRKMFKSPSIKGDDMTMRFKKKKIGQVC